MSKEERERRPHYECNHLTTICRDCDGSRMPETPWRIFTQKVRK